jgi:formyl-CoA transferase
MNYLIGGTAPRRRGTAHPNIVPYQVFPTRDGHLMLAVGNDRQFAACVQCLDVPELAKDIRFSGNADRLQHREELIALLSEAFRARDSAEWLKRLSDYSVPCGPINDIEQVFKSDYANERALVRQLKHPYDDAMPTVANPSRFSATPVSYRKAPPLLGQHTAEILADWLGYSAEKVAHLKSVGAV